MRNAKPVVLIVLLVLLLVGGWTIRYLFFQLPEEQLMRAQTKLIHAVEKRDWSTINGMMADEYMDDFGFDRATALQTAKDLLSGYFTLTLTTETTWNRGTNEIGVVKMKIKVEGNGTPVAQMVTDRVNATKEPWVFHWLKKGRWPWNWKLVQVQNEYVK